MAKDDISDCEPGFDDELRDEYDLNQLTGGVRGKYAERVARSTHEELLERVRKQGPVEVSESPAELLRKQRGELGEVS
jgi:RNA 3'-terminal phosphate cyclase